MNEVIVNDGINRPNVKHAKPTPEQLAQRYNYHAPKGDQVGRYETIRGLIRDLANTLVMATPCCPEQSRMLNALDDVMFLANASIARHE